MRAAAAAIQGRKARRLGREQRWRTATEPGERRSPASRRFSPTGRPPALCSLPSPMRDPPPPHPNLPLCSCCCAWMSEGHGPHAHRRAPFPNPISPHHHSHLPRLRFDPKSAAVSTLISVFFLQPPAPRGRRTSRQLGLRKPSRCRSRASEVAVCRGARTLTRATHLHLLTLTG
jgi:hypothetical protein